MNRLSTRLRAAAGLLAGRHTYLSTGCLHGDHDYCQNSSGQAGLKVAGACKFCPACCICDCHNETEGDA